MNKILSRAISILFIFTFVATNVKAVESEIKNKLDIQFVTVGKPGNYAYLETGFGRVDYEYNISKYVITNRQWAIFLNAVARYEDPFGLFNENMQKGLFGGIQRQEDDGRIIYRAKREMEELPVVYISWYDAARFCNWMEFGCPDYGYSGPNTTEGTNSSGSYDTRCECLTKIVRNNNAQYFIPSRNEWDKAAYYDHRLTPPGYWIYPNCQDEIPKGEPPPGTPISANVFDDHFACLKPYLSPVGAYKMALSPWGTFDQAGNVWEWTETCVSSRTISKWIRGGAATAYPFATAITNKWSEYPDHEIYIIGFRVVNIPSGYYFKPKNNDKIILNNLKDNILLWGNVAVWSICLFLGLLLRLIERSNGRHCCYICLIILLINVIMLNSNVCGVELDFMCVGNPGNHADKRTGYGRVNYVFEISKTEITNAQYAEFLNACAKHADPYGLFNQSQTEGLFGGIIRESNNGGFFYKAKPSWGRRPVVYVSWRSAARFANWLHYNQPNTGASEIGTTEGSNNLGAYNTQSFGGCNGRYSDCNHRNSTARYFLPTQDEWVKAAYYDYSKDDNPYWLFPTRSDTPPPNKPINHNKYAANYCNNTFSIGPPYYLSEVGSYPNAKSYYGILDAAGNVWEFCEDWRHASHSGQMVRALRGGSATYSHIGLKITNIDPAQPDHIRFVWGFRIARLPNDISHKFEFENKFCVYEETFFFKIKKLIKTLFPGWSKLTFLLFFSFLSGLVFMFFLTGIFILKILKRKRV